MAGTDLTIVEYDMPPEATDFSFIRGVRADQSSVKFSFDAFQKGVIGGAGFVINTVAEFAAKNIPLTVERVDVAGYYSIGDGGGHTKKRISTPSPAKPWHSQSADGAWWEIAEPFVTPEMFGAENDGTTADDAAFAACVEWMKSRPTGGAIKLLASSTVDGGYRLNSSHNLWHDQPIEIEYSRGARVLCGLSGASSVMWVRTNPADPTLRGSRFAISGPSRVLFHSSVDSSMVGAVFLEARCASDFSFDSSNQHMWSHYRNNTAFRFSGLFNCDMTPVTVWGAGHRKPRKNAGAALFSISEGATSLQSSVSLFSAGDVGDTMTIGGEQMVISAYVSPTQVTVSRPATQTYTSVVGTFGSVRCTTTAASDVVTLESAVASSADVGRVVYILSAVTAFGGGSPKRALRSRIVEVVSATQIRLADAVPLSVTLGEIVFSPAVEISGGESGLDERTNDVNWIGLHLEQCRGTQLVVQDGLNVFFPSLKLHALGLSTNDDTATDYLAIFDSTAGTLGGDLEGVTCGRLGRNIVCGGFGLLRFDTVHGLATRRQPLVRVLDCLSSCVVSVGDWYLADKVDVQTLAEAFAVTGSGRFRQHGRLAAYNTDYGYPDHVGGNGFVPYGLLPTSNSDVYTGPNNTTRYTVALGSAVFGGVALGGGISAPAATGEYVAALALRGYALPPDLSGLLEVGGFEVITRVPSGGNVASQLEMKTRNTSGVLATRWVVGVSGGLAPAADNTHDIGTSSARVKKVYSYSADFSADVVFGLPPKLPTYTVATLPSAGTYARCLVYVSDGASNKRLAVSDGTNWRWPDGAIVS